MVHCKQSVPLQGVERVFMNFRKTFRVIQNPNPEVLIVTCFDPRFEEAMDAFPYEVLHLKKGAFILTKPGGGPTPLAYPVKTPSRCKAAAKQIMFTCNKFPSIVEVVLVSHGGKCGYYSTIPHHYYEDGMEEDDLSLGGSLMQIILPKHRINLYNAALINGGRETEFRRVPISQEILTPPFDWKKSYQLSH